ncbi:MAG: HAMP domain-containing histidine kinase [Myxococcales bacterium]|nr:HAMP domain-containing histidine kinase [Myxococcales bacterium]MCB9732654.1 HAMP domain-containing histidine kinase [Deltaproteobacteria bacterium]
MPSSRRMVALLVAMVVVPLVALGALGARLVAGHRRAAKHQVTNLIEDRLREVDANIGRFMEDQENALLKLAEAVPLEVTDIRMQLRRERRDADVLVTELATGRLVYPPPGRPISEDEHDLLERTRTVWEGGALADAVRSGQRGGVDHGWVGFFHGGGLHLLLWWAHGERVVAIELQRIRLLSELVSYLPATATGSDDRTPYRTTLVDASGATVYQWGAYEPAPGEAPVATFSLSPPLSAWTLRHFSRVSDLPTSLSSTLEFNLIVMLVAVALALVALAVILFRIRTREMKIASERVTFVNQVSHELKTPLTNIRLYAELLTGHLGLDPDLDEEELAELDDPDVDVVASRYVGVITAESQRLSRLITNVLTFARGQEGRLEVRPSKRVVDDIVRATRATFGPTLEQAGVAVKLELAAPAVVHVDADALEQILANLLNNIEKYARSGGEARIATSQAGDTTTLRISDKGPGIPEAQRERIFEPFHRISDKLSDGVSGTGIGLDIARRLARLHGGDLRVVESAVGAAFELTIHTPREEVSP